MRIKRLYTEPATIDPITFKTGVNFILGESDETSSKNNGVGKSLCIEFLNFCFLKRKSDSRVAKVPKDFFDPTTFICVDFELNGDQYTIRRSLHESERPRISVGDLETIYAKIEDATNFLTGKMFPGLSDPSVGFRVMLGPLIRDERSEFKSIVAAYDTKARIPDDYAPHLMLLGIDINIYRSIKVILKELEELADEESRIKESIKLVRQKDFKEARSDLNALDDEVKTIREGIDALENAPAYDIVKGDILEIEDKMANLRQRKGVLIKRLASLAPIAVEPTVDSNDIRDFYDQFPFRHRGSLSFLNPPPSRSIAEFWAVSPKPTGTCHQCHLR